MSFSTYEFLFVFLPVVLLGWFGFNKFKQYNAALLFLVVMSLCFLGWTNYLYPIILLLSIIVNYSLSYSMEKNKNRIFLKVIISIGIIFNIGLLIYFKYYNFLIGTLNEVVRNSFTMKNMILPLGISFFTFIQIAFLVERYRGNATHENILYYLVFVTFFPQLSSGPIVLFDETLWLFKDKSKRIFCVENFTQGVTQFVIGLGKKILLADVLALVVNYGYDKIWYLDTPSAIVVMVAFSFELYFDFSGYCDMAIGIGKMFNIILPNNFNSPFKATSVKELWKRWHMTLNRFFLKYIYLPLGGNRKGRARTILNIMLVFSLSGLWHGANWTFIIWGSLQGIFVVLENMNVIHIKNKIVGWLYTFCVFNITFVFFRSDSVTTAWRMLRKLFGFSYTGFIFELARSLEISEVYVINQFLELKAPTWINAFYFILLIGILVISIVVIKGKNAIQIVEESKYSSKMCWGLTLILVWSIISLSKVSTFLYFNF